MARRPKGGSRSGGHDGAGDMLDLPLGPGDAVDERASGPPSLPLGQGVPEPGHRDPRHGDPRHGDPRHGDHRPVDPRREVGRSAVAGYGPRRPRRRRRGKGKRAWLWILLILVVVVAATVLILKPRAPRAAFSTELADLGSVRVAARSAVSSIEIANVGELPMLVEQVVLTGPAGADFEVASEDCTGRDLAELETCRVGLIFAPTTMGTREARLELHGALRRSPAGLDIEALGVAPVLEVDRGELEFGSIDVGARGDGLSLAVTNRGTAPLDIRDLEIGGAAKAEYSLRSDECTGHVLEPDDVCSVEISFVPRAAGPRRAELVFSSDAFGDVPAVALSGTGIWNGPTLTLETREVDFGELLLEAGADTKTIKLTNRQSAEVTGLTAGIDGDESFSVTGDGCSRGSVQPGASCSVTVSFNPREERTHEADLVVRHTVAEPIRVPLRGVGVVPRLVVAATDLDFGRVKVTEPSATIEVSLVNRGSASAPVDRIEVGGTEATTFRKIRDNCTGGRVKPGAGCVVELRFNPRREGTHEAVLSIEPVPAEGPARIPLTGFGIASRLVTDRESVDFGQVRRTTHKNLSLKLSNRGTGRLQVETVTVSGSGASAFSVAGSTCGAPASLEPGGECTLTLRFAPRADGRVTALLELGHDAFSGPGSVPLAGVGLEPPIARISVAPRFLDFGGQPVGRRSSIESVRVANPGTGRLELRDLRILGEHADDFRMVPATCEAVPDLVPGSDCSLGVRFVPGGVGDRSARLVIRHSATGGEVVLELRGRGM